ncbi:MAG TPA: site-specific DNA-methyltransferase, partial [Candidatus Bathyarchaeia archaeon]|nr:site-specific DNA-methyltransferase [Candidatus Bathyarchaeia archaeon]
MLSTEHRIILGNSQQMPELPYSTVHLMVTSPPYPMIKMWDDLFGRMNPKIAQLWQLLRAECREETVMRIYEGM